MELEPKPLPKDLVALLKKHKVEAFKLAFKGGDDEGCLDISVYPTHLEYIADKIRDWVWDVYRFNGAGEGTYYGTNIKYDLQTKEVTVIDWYDEYKRVEEKPVVMPIEYKAVKTTKKK